LKLGFNISLATGIAETVFVHKSADHLFYCSLFYMKSNRTLIKIVRKKRYKLEKEMILNDLHVHSIKSACGIHTLCEIVKICIGKGMRIVNISDHGPMHGYVKNMNYGVLTNKTRLPNPIVHPDGGEIIVLRGIEANILGIEGDTDATRWVERFDLLSVGLHSCRGKGMPTVVNGGTEHNNTTALENFTKKNPIDLLTHPCIATYPLDIATVVDLAVKYGFALEVNNTNLRGGKTNISKLRELILLAHEKDAILVENSDGHTYFEIGENDKINELLTEMGLNGDDLFLNRKSDELEDFISSRKALRAK
jgi:putative hydrolase